MPLKGRKLRACLELRAHLEDMPQEVYDMIFNLTFAPPTGIIRIEPSSTGPKLDLNLMQVSRATRKRYSTSHYDSSTYIASSCPVCFTWLEAMPQNHRLLLKTAQCLFLNFKGLLKDDPDADNRDIASKIVSGDFGCKPKLDRDFGMVTIKYYILVSRLSTCSDRNAR